MNRPWFPFYPVDYRGNANLRLCTLSSQGLWVLLLCYMHEGEPYGYLVLNGLVVDEKDLPSLVGKAADEVLPAWQELKDKRVVEWDPNRGAWYSRRMVRDEAARMVRAEAGKMGGNPALTGKTSKSTPKRRAVNRVVKRESEGEDYPALTLTSDCTGKRSSLDADIVDVLTAINQALVSHGQAPLDVSAKGNVQPVRERLKEGWSKDDCSLIATWIINVGYQEPKYWHPENLLRKTRMAAHLQRAKAGMTPARPQIPPDILRDATAIRTLYQRQLGDEKVGEDPDKDCEAIARLLQAGVARDEIEIAIRKYGAKMDMQWFRAESLRSFLNTFQKGR